VQVRGREQNIPRISRRSSGEGIDAGGYPHKTAELGPRLQWRVGRNGRRFRKLAAFFFFRMAKIYRQNAKSKRLKKFEK
jgi:hypothetical protein